MKQILLIIKNIKMILILLLLAIAIIASYTTYKKAKNYKEQLINVKNELLYSQELRNDEARVFNSTIRNLKELLRVKEELLSKSSQKELELIKALDLKKKELRDLEKVIGTSYVAKVDTIYKDKQVYVYNDSCMVNYNDGFLNLSMVAVNGENSLKYIYSDKVNMAIIRTKYHDDWSEIRFKKLYFWKKWTTKIRIKLDNPNAVVDTLIYINYR